MTTSQKLIEKQKELIIALSEDEPACLYVRRLESEIASLESELAKEQKPEGVTAEETTQLSGLSDYELQLELIVDNIRSTESTLECIGILRKAIDLHEGIAELEKQVEQELAKEHETCDGCAMFQDCGCMLDDSCPPCFEHSMWSATDNDPFEEQEVPDDDNSCCTRFKQWQSQQIEMLKKQIDEQKTVSNEIDKNWIFEIMDKTNVFAKQLIEDHFKRHIKVYSRPECPFNYCDDPEECKKLNKCHHT